MHGKEVTIILSRVFLPLFTSSIFYCTFSITCSYFIFKNLLKCRGKYGYITASSMRKYISELWDLSQWIMSIWSTQIWRFNLGNNLFTHAYQKENNEFISLNIYFLGRGLVKWPTTWQLLYILLWDYFIVPGCLLIKLLNHFEKWGRTIYLQINERNLIRTSFPYPTKMKEFLFP